MSKGSYVLGLFLDKNATLTVGQLGHFEFTTGYYVYAGSALGPGGLAARLARHRQREKRLRWHVDYLLTRAHLTEAWTIVSDRRLECVWAQALKALPGAQVLVPRFGASDCRCLTHLIFFPQPPQTARITAALRGCIGKDEMIAHSGEDQESVEHWLCVLIEGDDDARERAVRALGVAGETSLPLLLPLLDNKDTDIRCWALWALAHTGSPDVLQPLLIALNDADADARICAAMALGQLRAAEAAPFLIAQLLESQSGLLVRCAADALEKIGEGAVPALMTALEHPHSQVRVWATRALGRIGSPTAVEALCRVYLHDDSYLAQHYAEEALRRLGLFDIVLFSSG